MHFFQTHRKILKHCSTANTYFTFFCFNHCKNKRICSFYMSNSKLVPRTLRLHDGKKKTLSSILLIQQNASTAEEQLCAPTSSVQRLTGSFETVWNDCSIKYAYLSVHVGLKSGQARIYSPIDPGFYSASSRELATGHVPNALKFKEVMKKLSRRDKNTSLLPQKVFSLPFPFTCFVLKTFSCFFLTEFRLWRFNDIIKLQQNHR